ncbi:restriction endonuclease subunit S [bacterium 19CA06SA08-2]|uniref:Restriction endonuclease subunit S n=1 Tax=bacterium 19CA06SA08-2 TaxID=2920658 RepID=A0AAU6U913_UNCXX
MYFELTTIGQYATVQGGYAFKSKDFQQSGYLPVLKIKNVRHGYVEYSDCAYVNMDIALACEKWRTRYGDILISMTGSGPSAPESLVGRVARVWESEPTALINQRVGKLVLKEGQAIDKDFLFYVLTQKTSQEFLVSNATGSANQVNISSATIESVPCPNITYRESHQISCFLNMLNQRERLLRETNATLEAIAQALFKSWFVDFDPVHARARGKQPAGLAPEVAALFPDSFEESALGLVPKGWRVTILGDLCSVTIGGLWGKDNQEDSDLVPAISLRGVDLEHLRVNGFSKEAPVRWVKPSAMEKRRLSDTEVLVAASGAGPCGRPLWAGVQFEAIYGLPVIFSNFVKRFECGTATRAIYVDRLLAEMRENKEIWNFINGTSVPNLDDKLLLSTKKVVLPPEDVMCAFVDVVKAIYDRLYDQKAQTLATLRDTLLPRLISGQLRLPDAEQQLKDLAV